MGTRVKPNGWVRFSFSVRWQAVGMTANVIIQRQLYWKLFYKTKSIWFWRGKWPFSLSMLVVRVNIIALSNKWPDKRSIFCSDLRWSRSWWHLVAAPLTAKPPENMRVAAWPRFNNCPLNVLLQNLLLFSDKGKMLQIRVIVSQGFATVKPGR